jgi:hypothetical protein
MNRVFVVIFVVIFAHKFLDFLIWRKIPYHVEFAELFERTRIINGGFDFEVREITVVALGKVQSFCDAG